MKRYVVLGGKAYVLQPSDAIPGCTPSHGFEEAVAIMAALGIDSVPTLTGEEPQISLDPTHGVHDGGYLRRKAPR